MKSAAPYGLVAEFAGPEGLIAAARSLHAAGIGGVEAYTPYPVEGLAGALGRPPSRVPGIILAAGLAGAAAGFLLQYIGMKFGYALNIGGRPLDSWPAYLPSTYEIAVLTALCVGFAAYVAAARLAALYDPVLNAPGFEGASQDRFLLCIPASQPRFDRERIDALLAPAAPSRVAEIPRLPGR